MTDKPMPEVTDHGHRTTGGVRFSCFVPNCSPTFVRIGSEDIAVKDLLEIVEHVKACELIARHVPETLPF